MRRLLFSMILMATLSGAAQAEQVTLDKLEAFLISSRDGKLSDDLITTKPALWNTVIASDGARADDVLLVAHFKTIAQAKKPDRPSIKVTDKDGKQVYALKNFYLTFVGEADSSKAFLLRDVTCQHLKIVITSGKHKWNNEIPFECGE
ncbi:hypothetical protein [Aestuariivirga litoralis]|uniref:hypothetical protein n=1 Tax=Aestuariivirga litoralis TaxID=2650924 RepID=UPI0018C69E03|nr:hypothetical protein [Aestuariivirga litoralis]MBG1232802.1 hypothetical protein [Aestuariivirga litoralis]